jgi:hypothetical protein
MTPWRQRMIEDRQLRGMSECTQEMSVRAVRPLADHDHTSPDQMTEAALRTSFLILKKDKHYSRRARPMALCGITFFYAQTLTRAWPTLTFVRAPREQKLPAIRSVDEVRTMLAPLKLLRSRVCLTPIDSCGLRVQEGPPAGTRS